MHWRVSFLLLLLPVFAEEMNLETANALVEIVNHFRCRYARDDVVWDPELASDVKKISVNETTETDVETTTVPPPSAESTSTVAPAETGETVTVPEARRRRLRRRLSVQTDLLKRFKTDISAWHDAAFKANGDQRLLSKRTTGIGCYDDGKTLKCAFALTEEADEEADRIEEKKGEEACTKTYAAWATEEKISQPLLIGLIVGFVVLLVCFASLIIHRVKNKKFRDPDANPNPIGSPVSMGASSLSFLTPYVGHRPDIKSPQPRV